MQSQSAVEGNVDVISGTQRGQSLITSAIDNMAIVAYQSQSAALNS